jgi:membrane-associated phospholipid phosphatase
MTTAAHHRTGLQTRAPKHERPAEDDILEARPDRPAERVGTAAHRMHPVLVAALVGLVGAVVVGAVVVGIGLLLTHVLLAGPIGSWDGSVSRWFVARRTPTWNTWTDIGSQLGETITVVAVALVTTVVCAIKRWWRELGLLLVGLAVEFSVFLTATVVVNRTRPSVPRLDVSPPTSSYPSGHTAAGLVLYAALAIIVGVHVRNAAVRAILWILAVILPIAIGVSRIYRGMHHATDVLASVVLGIGALLVALFAVRVADAAAHRRAADAPGSSS